jgi:hypothetical protein
LKPGFSPVKIILRNRLTFSNIHRQENAMLSDPEMRKNSFQGKFVMYCNQRLLFKGWDSGCKAVGESVANVSVFA